MTQSIGCRPAFKGRGSATDSAAERGESEKQMLNNVKKKMNSLKVWFPALNTKLAPVFERAEY